MKCLKITMSYHLILNANDIAISEAMNADFLELFTFAPQTEFNAFQNPTYPIVRWKGRKSFNTTNWACLLIC